MLKVNLAGLSEEELERVLTERLSIYGAVKKLKIYLSRKNSVARPFALVDMETTEDAARLAGAVGRLAMDKSVIIFLQQEKASASTLIQARGGADVAGLFPPLII